MSEIVHPPEVLDQIKEFPPLHRILLCQPGTLQGTLSAYFCAPVTVRVLEQRAKDDYIERSVALECRGVDVCHAKSILTVDDSAARKLIRHQKMGIGQILENLGIRPEFNLLSVGGRGNYHSFWRIYQLRAPQVFYEIRETFPADLYQGALTMATGDLADRIMV